MTGCVVWFSGLPASGKTTLARQARAALRGRGTPCCLLDSDELRDIFDPPLGYGEAERERFYGFVGRLAAQLAGQGLVVLVAATAYRRRWREAARRLAPRYLEVQLAATVAECRERDPKGLYRRAELGEIDSLPGVGVPFEVAEDPDVVARSGAGDAAVAELLALIGCQAQDQPRH